MTFADCGLQLGRNSALVGPKYITQVSTVSSITEMGINQSAVGKCHTPHREKWQKGHESFHGGLLHLLDERLRRRLPFSVAFFVLVLPWA